MLNMFTSLLTIAAPPVDIQAVVNASAAFFNVSLSAAFTLSDGTTSAFAAGPDNRAVAGSFVTPSSLYPSGSVTKTFTATAAMRLVEKKKLQLDEPFHQVVDPWLKKQGEPSLLQLWNNDTTIQTVTVRHLLQMRSGIPDYNDQVLRQWSIDHPKQDWLPSNYIKNVSRTFLFAPGSGGAYSGVGYVLLGWVLCAATDGCNKWSDLDQAALVKTKHFSLGEETIFMKTGACSQYDGVVHQYCFDPRPAAASSSSRYELELRLSTSNVDALDPLPGHCAHPQKGPKGNWFDQTEINGVPPMSTKNITTGGASACCGASDGVPGAILWTFLPSSGGAGVCKFYAAVPGIKGKHNPSATSGKSDPMLHESDFVDVYNGSCLNGWTMGNIATSPAGVTKFYHALFGGEGQILKPETVPLMMEWKPLTTGFSPGTQYGFGLMLGQLTVPIDLPKRQCGTLPFCKCSIFGCAFQTYTVGHAGLDYGSGMALIGYMMGLNVSYAVASNTGESPMGMNSSMTESQNGNFLGSVYCPLLDGIVQKQLPGYPQFKCGPKRE